MLSSLYHRSLKPFIYPINESQVIVRFQVEKNHFEAIEVLVNNFKILDNNDLYHQHNVNQDIIEMELKGSTDFCDYFEAIIENTANYVFKLIDSSHNSYYYGFGGIISEHQTKELMFNFQVETKFETINQPNWFNNQTWFQINWNDKDRINNFKLWLNELKNLGFTGVVINSENNKEISKNANLVTMIKQIKVLDLKVILSVNDPINLNDWMKDGFNGLIINANLNLQDWQELRMNFNKLYPDAILLNNHLNEQSQLINQNYCHGSSNNFLTWNTLTYLNSNQELKDKLVMVNHHNTYNTLYSPDLQKLMINGLMLSPTFQTNFKVINQNFDKLKWWINFILLTNSNASLWIEPNLIHQIEIKQIINQALVNKQSILQSQSASWLKLGDKDHFILENNEYVILFNEKTEILSSHLNESESIFVT